MSPYNDTNIIREALYIALWFCWAFISIVYWIIWGKKISLLHSLWMILIGWFIWWAWWTLTDSTLVAWIWWALSLEIMHSLKEYWPELIKERIKNLIKK